jgi:hypothetical protein
MDELFFERPLNHSNTAITVEPLRCKIVIVFLPMVQDRLVDISSPEWKANLKDSLGHLIENLA